MFESNLQLTGLNFPQGMIAFV